MAIRFGIIFIDNIDNFFIGNDRRKTEQQLRSILERKKEYNFLYQVSL